MRRGSASLRKNGVPGFLFTLTNGTLLSKKRTFHTRCPPAAYPVEHVCPALHGDALKHGEHGKGKVIKVGDASVWANPATPTLRAIGGTLASIP